MKAIDCMLVAVLLPVCLVAQPVFEPGGPGEARDRSYDVLHYRIEVSFDEPARKVLGRTTITLVPFIETMRSFDLDAEQMNIHGVTLGRNTPARFEVLSKVLRVYCDRAYSLDDTLRVSVEYSCTPRKGLYFVQPDSAYPGRPRQIWTQGEDMDNHCWFPCYDFPNDLATSEVLATVPQNLAVLSNGKLVSVRDDRARKTRTFHWRTRKPHASYLIMLAIGEYAVLRDRSGSTPLEYYVYPHHTDDARICFAETPRILRFFSESIGFPYPWEKYAQVLIHEFVVGGMENTSATSLLDEITVFDARGRVDHSPVSLIAHELAHQWWGDVVTCKDWRHLWLNESFASYFDPLYTEFTSGRDEFDYRMYENQHAGINVDRRLGRKPIVSAGSYGENVYPRGSAVLHMLRFLLGDRLFWRAINHYITTYQHRPVETDDFKTAIEEATGQNLSWFFDQWVYRAGLPHFQVVHHWSDSSAELSVRVRQIQTMDSLTGVFRTPVNIEMVCPEGRQVSRVTVASAETTFVFPLPHRPTLVIFDSGNWLLKELTHEKPTEEWLIQAESARNPVDRIRAIQALASDSSRSQHLGVLARLATTDVFWAVRREAVRALGGIPRMSDSLAIVVRGSLLAASRDTQPPVRATAVGLLGNTPAEETSQALRSALADSSAAVVTAALRALTRVDSAASVAVLRSHLEVPSHGNAIASAALSSLQHVDSAGALSLARERIVYGQPVPIRYSALGILRRSVEKDSSLLSLFASLAGDRNRWIRSSAIRTLGEHGDLKCLDILDAIAGNPEDHLAQTAREGADRIRKRLAGEGGR